MRPQVSEMEQKPSFWQMVFLQSKVNGAPYEGEKLAGRIWDWPKDTYLQRRLKKIRRFSAASQFN